MGTMKYCFCLDFTDKQSITENVKALFHFDPQVRGISFVLFSCGSCSG